MRKIFILWLCLLGSSVQAGDVDNRNITPYTTAGSWTPADGSGAALSFTGVSAAYMQIGNMIFAYFQLTYPSTANGSNAVISGFPVAAANVDYARQCNISFSNSATSVAHAIMLKGTSTMAPFTAAGVQVTNVQLTTAQINGMCIYPIS